MSLSAISGHNAPVTSTLGSAGAAGASPTPLTATSARPPVPAATRSSSPGWRDPRLWIGIAIVAASVLVGVRVLAGADDTVAVWVVADDAGQGETLSVDDLVSERVRFADADQLARYFTLDDPLPDELRLLRALGAGELLPRGAIGEPQADESVEISLPVAPLLVPPAVSAGSVVDVYLSDRAVGADLGGRQGEPTSTAPALREVSVVDAPAAGESFAASGDRQVVLAVAADGVEAFYATMDAMDDPVVTIVRHR